MDQDRTKRKLTAIFSADVKDYSRLMSQDEVGTIKNLKSYRELISNFVQQYQGRIIDSPGDNILAAFESVSNAVNCAVEIQRELAERNAQIPSSRMMQWRIGINLGDVVEDDDRIYGDGVNIAARIEALAEAGGISISGTVYDHVKNKLGLEYEYLGEQEVKNIDEPVRVYRVLMGSENAGKVIGEKKAPSMASRRIAIAAIIILIIIAAGLLFWNIYSHRSRKIETASTEPEQAPVVKDIEETPAVVDVVEGKKTIAVLPFDDLSPEKDQEYFTDGIAEELLNSLTRISELEVRGRTSSFYFKDRKEDSRTISEMLNVEYILEGSVRKAGEQVRITVQLINTRKDAHIWSETYDRELKDIFKIQEDIANNVADKLKLSLEAFNLVGGTDNVEAYEHYLIAKGQIQNPDRVVLNRAMEYIDAAIALDPKFVLAWVMKSTIHLDLVVHGLSNDADSELAASLSAIQRAIEIDPNSAEAHAVLGEYRVNLGEWIEAERAFQKALELGTGKLSEIKNIIGSFYIVIGFFKKANELFEEAQQNDPLNQDIRASHILSSAFLGNMQQAEEAYKRGKELFGEQWIYGNLLITMARLGTGHVVSSDRIVYSDPIWDATKEHLDSPEKGLAELRRLYSGDGLSSRNFIHIADWAAYFGDSEFAMDALEKGLDIQASGIFNIWYPTMRKVRQTPRFKEFVRKIGLVDYWNEFGWPDICHKLENGDFECD